MAKILILYYSRSGNTKKMAELVAEGAQTQPGVEILIKPIVECPPGEWGTFDAILIGSPVYYGMPSAEIKQALDASVKFHGKFRGKLGGAFASSANIGGGNETTILDILHAWLIHGMLIIGEPFGDHYGPVSIGAPDDRARENCLDYGKLIAKTAVQLFH